MDDSRWTTGDASVRFDARTGAGAVRRVRRIQLAREAPVQLGPLAIEPALRRISDDAGREEFLQPRVMQVLVALTHACGEILSRDDLLESCWHGVVVGEDAVDRVIGRVRRLCEQLAPGALRLETIARVGYRLIAAEPGRRAEEPAPGAEPPAETAPVLAVLAFDNLSGDTGFRYFSDGISEEILLTVGRSTGLTVVGRSSSFQFRGADKAARRVADALGATHVLDGAVRRSGDSVRVSAELVDCATQTCLWSARFDRLLEDVFTLQDDIAAAVAEALKVQFAPSTPVGPIDPIAYDLYLRARDRNLEGMGYDVALLEAATERAPNFAQAWALLAFARVIMLRWSSANESAPARAEVLQAAHRALTLDPAAAYAYLALETASPLCGHHRERIELVEKALAAAPNDAVVLVHAAGMHDNLGYQRVAYGYIVRAYQLDPRHASFYHPCLLESIGLITEARASLDHDLARWPDSVALRTVAMRFAIEAGDWARYEQEFAALTPAYRAEPFFGYMSRYADQVRNWSPAVGADILRHLREILAATGTLPFSQLGFPARQGLSDEIYELIAQASFDHLHRPDGRLMYGEFSLNVLFSPMFATLRRDPRFADLCVRLGFADHWLETDLWPDFLAEVAPYYDLKAEVRRLCDPPRPRAVAAR